MAERRKSGGVEGRVAAAGTNQQQVAKVPMVKYDTKFPAEFPKFLRRTEGPVTALSKRQQDEYWKQHGQR